MAKLVTDKTRSTDFQDSSKYFCLVFENMMARTSRKKERKVPERERERQTERQTDRQIDRQTDS